MKYVFVTFLVLNFLAETLAAVSLIGGPEGIAAAGTGNQWAMHYGFAVIAIAAASLWIWPYRTQLVPVTAVLGILLTFHAAVFVSLTLAGDQQFGIVLHLVLTVLAGISLSQRRKWCEP